MRQKKAKLIRKKVKQYKKEQVKRIMQQIYGLPFKYRLKLAIKIIRGK